MLTSSDEGLEAALDLADGGVNVLAVADSRRDADGSILEDAGIEYLAGFRPWQAKGSKAVSRRRSSRATASTAPWPATCL